MVLWDIAGSHLHSDTYTPHFHFHDKAIITCLYHCSRSDSDSFVAPNKNTVSIKRSKRIIYLALFNWIQPNRVEGNLLFLFSFPWQKNMPESSFLEGAPSSPASTQLDPISEDQLQGLSWRSKPWGNLPATQPYSCDYSSFFSSLSTILFQWLKPCRFHYCVSSRSIDAVALLENKLPMHRDPDASCDLNLPPQLSTSQAAPLLVNGLTFSSKNAIIRFRPLMF